MNRPVVLPHFEPVLPGVEGLGGVNRTAWVLLTQEGKVVGVCGRSRKCPDEAAALRKLLGSVRTGWSVIELPWDEARAALQDSVKVKDDTPWKAQLHAADAAIAALAEDLAASLIPPGLWHADALATRLRARRRALTTRSDR